MGPWLIDSFDSSLHSQHLSVSGFGGVITFYVPEYSAPGKDYAAISQLMTYPTLFM